MGVIDNIKLAFRAIRSNLLRTILTMLIIAFGLTALVGILTALDSITVSINSNFTSMGANTFTIRELPATGRHQSGIIAPVKKLLTYKEVTSFKERFDFDAEVALSTMASFSATVQHGDEKTNPNVRIMGVDDNYMHAAGLEVTEGRNFSELEVKSGNNVAIIGWDIYSRLFDKKTEVLEEDLYIGNIKYKVIGVLKSKGSSLMGAGDNQVLISITNSRSRFSNPNGRYVVSVVVTTPDLLDPAISEANSLFRNIRRIKLGDPDNFQVRRSDSLANSLVDNLQQVAAFAAIIGFITLLGAAIALMNILLVSVTERTREIGISKAIGAKKSTIRVQFLVEALVICQLGGLLGIFLGIMVGNVVSMLLGTHFIIPWLWIISGISICMIVGLVSGIYPAFKASKLDPIEALRYE